MGRWINYYEVYGDMPIQPKAKMRDFKKPNNNVPKSIKGDYDMSIHGNKIVLVDKKDGTTVEAKCHPEDNFDIKNGIEEAFKKLNEKRARICEAEELEKQKIKIGDWVEVIYPGESFSSMSDFFNRYNLEHYATRYRFGVTPKKGTKGRIVEIVKATDYYDFNYYVVEVPKDPQYGDENYSDLSCYDAIYIIGKDGVRKVKQ